MNLKVELKQAAGKNAGLVLQELTIDGAPADVRELLTATVASVHADFLARKHSTVPVVSEQADRIRFGFFYNEKEPPLEQAIGVALQAFADGVVALFIDGVRYEDLDAPLHLTGRETLAFVKLTFLAGRMW